MTENEKRLLLKDLSSRLPYEVICQVMDGENGFDKDILTQVHSNGMVSVGYLHLPVIKVKPYLRPLSSMRMDEEMELCTRAYAPDEMKNIKDKLYVINLNAQNATDFYNEHMFDYRGLIEKGLALEAPEDMYQIL